MRYSSTTLEILNEIGSNASNLLQPANLHVMLLMMSQGRDVTQNACLKAEVEQRSRLAGTIVEVQTIRPC